MIAEIIPFTKKEEKATNGSMVAAFHIGSLPGEDHTPIPVP